MSALPSQTLRPLLTRMAPLLLAGLLVSGCGEDADTPETAPEENGPTTVQVTYEAGTFSPQGERVEVEVDQPVVLEITADEPGELHVHSTPEQEITFEAGTTEHQVVIGRPGVVEVESHDPTLVVLQLEVR